MVTLISESKNRRLKESAELKKVNVTTAKKVFNAGNTVYLLPNKVKLDNAWIKPFAIDSETSLGKSWENIINSYAYYNCNKDTGTNIAYYIDAE